MGAKLNPAEKWYTCTLRPIVGSFPMRVKIKGVNCGEDELYKFGRACFTENLTTEEMERLSLVEVKRPRNYIYLINK